MGKLIIVLITTLSFQSKDDYQSIEGYGKQNELPVSTAPNMFTKENALQILDNKCNVCHRKRNKRRVFTSENMDTWANDIYKQVFIRKRMPKGNKIKLTAKEYQELLTWITSTKNNQNGNKH
ncbi:MULTISPECIES: hypothetical protein [unclassified Allomuricauda]|uniref:hypothetical protein n=1 Tax=unclassified Allomuricauda TaxID=2615049 RepID=UPI00273F4487|nr:MULTISPECIES: hypothetical protein [unclassified Allomuricauda]